nr:Chain U, Tribbles homolog 1 [Homo sapiens]
SDQIVPEYQED